MKSVRRLLVSVIMIAAVIALAGCMSTITAVGDLINEMDAAVAGSIDAERDASAGLFGNLAVFERTMLFNVAYFQVFFMGGFDPGFEDFREGEGVTWEISSSDDDASFTTERALLKRVADGSWWYIAYGIDDEDLEYEVLLDDEYTPVEIVWQDPDSNEILHHIFDYGEDSEEEVPAEEEPATYSENIDEKYKRGSERITVGAGTFTAEYVVYDFADSESSDTLEYHWWIVPNVPGDLVKYEYRQTSDGEESTLTGELMSIDTGYRTEFGSY